MASNQQPDSLSEYRSQFSWRGPGKLPSPRPDELTPREPSLQQKRRVMAHESSSAKDEPGIQHKRRVSPQRRALSAEPPLERRKKATEQYRATLQLPQKEFAILGPKDKEVTYFPRYLHYDDPRSTAHSPIRAWDPDMSPPSSPLHDNPLHPAPIVVLPKPPRAWSPEEEPVQDRPQRPAIRPSRAPRPAALPVPTVAAPVPVATRASGLDAVHVPVATRVSGLDAVHVPTIRPATAGPRLARKAGFRPPTPRSAAPAPTPAKAPAAPAPQPDVSRPSDLDQLLARTSVPPTQPLARAASVPSGLDYRTAIYPSWSAISRSYAPHYESEYRSQYRPPDPVWMKQLADVRVRVKDMRQRALGLLSEHVVRAAQEAFAQKTQSQVQARP